MTVRHRFVKKFRQWICNRFAMAVKICNRFGTVPLVRQWLCNRFARQWICNRFPTAVIQKLGNRFATILQQISLESCPSHLHQSNYMMKTDFPTALSKQPTNPLQTICKPGKNHFRTESKPFSNCDPNPKQSQLRTISNLVQQTVQPILI